MFYEHLESHSITISHILNAVHFTGDLPLSHKIVPENIPLPFSCPNCITAIIQNVIKRPARDACLCMGELQAPAAPPAPHFVFLITL